jgi:pyruvate dehydrogenase E2 component (dihydrolipoamide acetyltransferase)
MASIHPVTIPKWGIEMQEGTITGWRIEAGSPVQKGDELVDIESDKIVNTMEAPASGVLRRIVAGVDETLKVGQLLAVIADAGVSDREVDEFIAGYVPADASFGIDDDEPPAVSAAEAPRPGATAAAGPAAAQVDTSRLVVSPVARRLAQKLGVDITRVAGSGRGGRIVTADIEAAAANPPATGTRVAAASPAQAADAPASTPAAAESPAVAGAQPLSGRALSAARRMVEAKQNIPHFYLQRELDMRAALAAKQRDGVPLTALLLKAMATAMQAQPQVNVHFSDQALHPQKGAAINVAIDTPEGLVAPLLSGCDEQDVAGLAASLKDLAEKARRRELAATDLQAGGITLSNLGMFGISSFSAIINPPQVAILAVGGVRATEPAAGESPVATMSATLSCDHRALDGASGARFLAALQDALNEL